MEESDHIEGTGMEKASARPLGREMRQVEGRGDGQPMGRLDEMVDWARWVLVEVTTSVVVQVPVAAVGFRLLDQLDRGATDPNLATGTAIADSGQVSTHELVVRIVVHW